MDNLPDLKEGEWRDEELTLTSDEKRMIYDYDWALHDCEVNREFAGKFVAVFDRKVVGAGVNRQEALERARMHEGCPVHPEHELTFVPISGVCPVYSRG